MSGDVLVAVVVGSRTTQAVAYDLSGNEIACSSELVQLVNQIPNIGSNIIALALTQHDDVTKNLVTSELIKQAGIRADILVLQLPSAAVCTSIGAGILNLNQTNCALDFDQNESANASLNWLLGLTNNILSGHLDERCWYEILERYDNKIRDAKNGQVLFHVGPVNTRAMFTGLEIGHSLADMMRSVFESISFTTRDRILSTGQMPREIRVCGRLAQSKAMQLMLASVLNTVVQPVWRKNSAAAGAAMQAAVECKAFADMGHCVAQWVQPQLGEKTYPQTDLVNAYQRIQPVYAAAQNTSAPLFMSYPPDESEHNHVS
jgi:sugar (pentulose or hexulose) kinase